MEPVTRRQWLELAGFCGAGTLLSLAFPSDSPPHHDPDPIRQDSVSFRAWYQANLDSKYGNTSRPQEYFAYPFFKDTRAKIGAMESIDNAFRRDALSIYGAIPKILKRSFKNEHQFLPVDLSESTLREYQQRVQDELQHFFAFLGIPELTPTIIFHALRPDTVLESRRGNVFPVYLAWHAYEQTTGTYEVDAIPNTYLRQFNLPMPGGTQPPFALKDSNGNFTVLAKTESATFLTLSQGPLVGIEAPLAEVLHMVNGDFAASFLYRSLDEVRLQRGNPFTKEELLRVTYEIRKRDEGIVHALTDHYLNLRASVLGLRQADFDDVRRREIPDPAYNLVSVVKQKIQASSPQAVYQQYLKDQTVVFGPLQI